MDGTSPRLTGATPRSSATLSAAQVAKRDLIVEAAVKVLLTEGVHGCTVRAVANEAGMVKGNVHYYFQDIDEVIDEAMSRATQAWLSWMRERKSEIQSETPGQTGSWRLLAGSLEPFAGDRALLPLWLEYWAIRTRGGRLEPLRSMHRLLTEFVSDLLSQTQNRESIAKGIVAYLLGAAMQETIAEVNLEEVLNLLSLLSDSSRE
jgi:AcrR family transcriptional regulator